MIGVAIIVGVIALLFMRKGERQLDTAKTPNEAVVGFGKSALGTLIFAVAIFIVVLAFAAAVPLPPR